MKTTYETNASINSLDICSAQYAPPATLTSKTALTTDFVFNKQKVHLNSTLMSKAVNTKTIEVIVDIDMSCNPLPESLSSHVLQQNSAEKTNFKHHAFTYIINNTHFDENTFTQSAETDPCVLGVTLPGTLTTTSLALPNTSDPSLFRQTQLQNENYFHAYEYLVKTATGVRKARVGFIDTGADCSHEDLSNNLVSTCGYNAVTADPVSDNDGHGSHTLGIVGAVTNNNKGILGLAGNLIEMHAIKVIDVNSGTAEDAAEGIQYAISQNLDVINISLESAQTLPLIEQRVQEAVAAGIVVVIAAGNSSANISPVNNIIASPAMIAKNLDGAISVTSVNADSLLLSSFSNYGSYVEIAAIGSLTNSNTTDAGIYSTSSSNSYRRMMGTSQAAPVITGAAALLIQFFKQNNVNYTAAQIEQIIKHSVDKNAALSISGNGVINFSKLTRNAYQFANIPLCAKK